MFTSVERRLAILNVSVVVAIVALIGMGTWILLGRSLDREADASLEIRIQSARDTLTSLPSMVPANTVQAAPQPTPTPGDDHDEEDDSEHEDDHEKENREIVISGDTLVFVFDDHGNLVSNRRNVTTDGIPEAEGVDAALNGETDTRFVTVDGERVRVRTEPVFHEGDVVGAIQAVRSETEHDDELNLVRTMTLVGTGVGVLVAVPAGIYLTRRAMAPINDVLQRQQAFVSDAAHELRTPLTVLRANAEVVSRTPSLSHEELRRDMQAMVDDIDGMSHMVDELLHLSRVDNPNYAAEMRDLPLRSEVDRAVDMLATQAERGGVQVSASGDDLSIRSNPEMVGQVIRIVLENAIKYTPAGGTVQVSTYRHGGDAVIEIRDTGIGILPEELPYVFDRFYRADKARTRSTGTGLGLSIAFGLLNVLGGSITVESIPQQGTTVHITFPLANV